MIGISGGDEKEKLVLGVKGRLFLYDK